MLIILSSLADGALLLLYPAERKLLAAFFHFLPGLMCVRTYWLRGHEQIFRALGISFVHIGIEHFHHDVARMPTLKTGMVVTG